MLGALLGNYRVVEQLGEGGMGVVYVGRHETLGSRVVVKVLKPQMSRNAGMVQRFFNEAQAATAIRNPGIAQVFDFGATPDGRVYFVMELLDGESLTARLARRRLDYAECCRLVRQIANVLQASHTAGITHRDLKPDNLFLVPDAEVSGGERVKVLDFGIAKLTGDTVGVKTRTGMVMGTPNYMSPEQCRGASHAEPRSDIYSLGCILFKMTCGRPPFVGRDLGDIVAGHLYVAPPHPQSLAPDMPDALAALIAKMLEKPPEARPQTMAVVSQMLDEILATLDAQPQREPTTLPVRAPTPLPGVAPMQARPPTPLPVVSTPEHTPSSEDSLMPGDGSTSRITDTSVSFLDTSVSIVDDGSLPPSSPAVTPPVRPPPPPEPFSSTVDEVTTTPFSLALTPTPAPAPVSASKPWSPTAEALATAPFSTAASPPVRAPTPLPVPSALPAEDRALAPFSPSSPPMARAPVPFLMTHAPLASPRVSMPPVTQLSPTSTTIRGAAPAVGTRPQRRSLWPFVLGGLVCSGAGVAVALMLANC